MKNFNNHAIIMFFIVVSFLHAEDIQEARKQWRTNLETYQPAYEAYKDIIPDTNQEKFAVLIIGPGSMLNPVYAFPNISNFFIIDLFDAELVPFRRALKDYSEQSGLSKPMYAVKKILTKLSNNEISAEFKNGEEHYKYNFKDFNPGLTRNMQIWRENFKESNVIERALKAIKEKGLILKAVVFSRSVPDSFSEKLLPLIIELRKNKGFWIDEAAVNLKDEFQYSSGDDIDTVDIPYRIYFLHADKSEKEPIIIPTSASYKTLIVSY